MPFRVITEKLNFGTHGTFQRHQPVRELSEFKGNPKLSQPQDAETSLMEW